MGQTTEVAVEIIGETSRAFKVADGSVIEWLPKSQILEAYADGKELDVKRVRIGQTVTLTLPEWLAGLKGFI